MIQVQHLTKRYGDFLAVKDLSFEIEEGHVYGFLGPNGAGKSTTMNIMTGCLSATEGRVLIDGCDIYEEPVRAKKMIGYLPEQPPVYMNETPVEYLSFVGEVKGLKGAALREQVSEAISRTGLESVQERLIGSLSKGYRQRVGIAQALLGNPKVIILDEPTVGLDPIQIIEIRDLVRSLGETHTVIFSSHILSEVRAICDRILIISRGTLVAFDTPENLETLMSSSNGVDLSALVPAKEAERILHSVPGIGEISCTDQADGTMNAHVQLASGDIRDVCCGIFFAFAEKHHPIFAMSSRKANLEDVFLELTESSGDEVPENIADEEDEEEEEKK